MSENLHLTQAEYADVLNLSYEVEKGNVTMGDFERYVMERHGAKPYTDNHIHVVRLIDRSGDKAPEEHKRYWHWCPRCKKFTNLWHTEELYQRAAIESLSAQLQ